MREIYIATAANRASRKWTTRSVRWEEFTDKLKKPVRTLETYQAYMRMAKAQQAELKDVGGFVGGQLVGGRRLAGNVTSRDLITLDMDAVPAGEDERIFGHIDLLGCVAVVYSTRKHSAEKPRLRVCVPTDRSMTPDEYEPCARMVAQRIGLDYCDPTTFDLNRLMYWPSCSSDSEYVYREYTGDLISVDSVLASYGANDRWRNIRLWPQVAGQEAKIKGDAARQQDPTEKDGAVGAWCRAYDIPTVIERHLSGVYLPTDDPDRYTYAFGSTTGGAILYNDGKFLFSHHGTDPCGGMLCNAWDLVRVHKFGGEDDPDTPINRRPSTQRMAEFAKNDPLFKDAFFKMQQEHARRDFEMIDVPEDSDDAPVEVMDWKTRYLSLGKDGVMPTVENFKSIILYDPAISGIAYDELGSRICVRNDAVPWARTDGTAWTQTDEAGLTEHMERQYALYNPTKQDKALWLAAMTKRFNPVKEYIESLPEWDHVERVDRLLIDYFSAEDNEYVRMATRKTLCAAIARVYRPGTKFDSVLVLRGAQGIGKSTFFAKLAKDWFSDSLSITDMRDKTGAEKLQGYWIVEIGELVGMRKTDAETIKAFISRTNDSYRPAYAPSVQDHPRRAIVVGTTNADSGFLRDITGNRRFWPVECGWGERSIQDITDNEIDQIWAEAKVLYNDHEPLFMTGKALELAIAAQEAAVEIDDRAGMVEEFLDRLLPEGWEEMGTPARRAWLAGDFGENKGTVRRTEVCRQEIYAECLGGNATGMDRSESAAIANIMGQLKDWIPASGTKRFGQYGVQRYYVRK